MWDILEEEGYFQQPAGFQFAGQDVMKCVQGEHEFNFAPADIALCLDYPRFLPEMNRFFADADMSGMITWHEGGGAPQGWSDETACRAPARTLTQVFGDDGEQAHNLLCVGGIHFEPNYAEAALYSWGAEALGVTHILANQWLVSEEYETEYGFERACACVDFIEGGIEAIVFHDKMKGWYKDLVRKLGAHYNVPIYKHQRIRSPETVEFTAR